TYVIGTLSAGINIFSKGEFKHLTTVPQLLQSNILSLMTDERSDLWVGTQFDGVFVLEKKGDTYSLKRHIKELNGVDILAAVRIIQDKKGSVWIATFSAGLFRLEGEKVTHYTSEKGLGTNNLLTLYCDVKDRLWIGTIDAGVLKFENEKFTAWSEKEGLANKSVWSISGDKKGNLYFGTGEGGLSCFDEKKFRNLGIADGLCSNYIPALTWDPVEDCLWLGTNNGINKVKLKDNFDIASIRLYSEQEGFKGIEVNQNGILLDDNGYLWLGTINGLSKYNRAFDSPNTTAPKLHLNNIQLFYQNVDWKNYTEEVDPRNNLPVSLNLSHRNNNLTFHFQALTADNVQYTFILEGQDEEWSPMTTNTQAVFSNINPGRSYTFKVKAVNSNGVWSNEVVSFSFSVAPPWWQTWWFYTLAVLLILVAVYAFINYRTSKLAKEKKILEEKVTERTVELKGANDKLSVAFNDIRDSINYAKKIQDAILPLEDEIKRALPQSFVLFKPRDVVSGDFYWFNRKEERIYIAAVDCTGHGVPGAFMSMIGNSLLNEIISKKGPHDAAGILKSLHKGVRKALKQDRNSYESKDGMDLALAVIDTGTNTLQYSGAKRSLFCFSEGVFSEVKADKQSIGGLEMEDDYHFTNHSFQLKKGDTFYLFTDGYVDQFGGEKGKKYSTKRLKETLAEMQSLTMA
ncbi:MAG: SpoIIE family protein phosphatase, partial [Bacteroidota bacterium]|nr:SpoIIE family protein phosphatase [Bacteroidota bacterium]